LFGQQRKGREQLHKYLDNYLGHSGRRRDLGIDIEALQKMFDQLEQVNQRIIAVGDALDRLTGLDITTMRA
jgi:hypothetical protein